MNFIASMLSGRAVVFEVKRLTKEQLFDGMFNQLDC